VTPGAARRLALFDLDGTITRGDTYRGFVLGLLVRRPARWLRAPLLAIPIAGYVLRFIDRGTLKGSILWLLFGGLSRTDVGAFSSSHAAVVLAKDAFPEALAAFRGHLAAGDHVVLLSASPDLYVPEIGQALGAHETFCTQVRWNGERLDGRLAGPNRRGQEKANVLAMLRSKHPGLPVIAYGNSTPDLDHMRLCEEAVYVNASSRLAAELAGAIPGIRCVQWR
jgi:phosphatidylglycerophosphatase C